MIDQLKCISFKEIYSNKTGSTYQDLNLDNEIVMSWNPFEEICHSCVPEQRTLALIAISRQHQSGVEDDLYMGSRVLQSQLRY